MAVEREVLDWGVRLTGTPFHWGKCVFGNQIGDRRLQAGEGFGSADYVPRYVPDESAAPARRAGVERGHDRHHQRDADVVANMKAEATRGGSKKKR